MDRPMRAKHSGLSLGTLRKYMRSDLLERGPGGEPIYMHHGLCPSFCDFACNSEHGFNIAKDLAAIFPAYFRNEPTEGSDSCS